MLKTNFHYILKAILLTLSLNSYPLFFKPVTEREILTRNLENNLEFRIIMAKTSLINLNNAKNNCSAKSYGHAIKDLSLATLAATAAITYPVNGNWEIYSKYFGISPQQDLALKLITLISSANACYYGFTKTAPWWYIETGLSIYSCSTPCFKIAWGFRG